ncbi:MAG: methylated-DNA--[protein]-cysteine S-methyltransferase [Caulobacter sp.]|nr:methylated-DNA--[protein]-cysteine S-methyltransferase [Caulobacter sp.]
MILSRLASPIGDLDAATDGAGRLRVLEFADKPQRLARALRRHAGAPIVTGTTPTAVAWGLEAYFAGDLAALASVPLTIGGTAFQQAVWTALVAIPAGRTDTYAGLARAMDRPSATRAVGAANGANPLAIVVPCHRLVGADGALTGYGGGVERKRWLLAHEGVD